MLSCVLLSAGLSSRFGSPKALARINDKTVIEDLQSLLLETQLDEIIIVLGHAAELITPFLFNHKKVKVVYNKDYKFGQTSSFKAGLGSVSPSSTGIMLLPVDYPLIKKETFSQLISQFEKEKPAILVPVYKNKKGHPPIFSSSLKDSFLSLNNDEGINTVIHQHPADTTLSPLGDAGIIKSFNTRAEFDQLKKESILGQQPQP